VPDNTRPTPTPRRAYEPPTITPVRLDPVRDMLSGCNTKASQAQCDPGNEGIPLLT
jgi:hypothetical protein